MTTESREGRFETLRERIVPLLTDHGVVRASVFGSVARGDDGDDSDVDILVVFEDGRSLMDLSALRLDLIDELGREVDVITPSGLHPRLRQRIRSELVRVV